MVGREADRARVVADRLQPQRARVADQGAEDAAAARKVADLGHRLGVDTGVDEALEPRARLVDHAERGVAGAGQGGGRLGQLPQQIVQRELRAERDAGSDESLQALLLLGRSGHWVDATAARPGSPRRYGAR